MLVNAIKPTVLFPVLLACLLIGLTISVVQADDKGSVSGGPASSAVEPEETEAADEDFDHVIGGNDQDPTVLLRHIERRRTQRDSLFGTSPLKPLHDATSRGEDKLYEATHIKAGLSVHHLFQWLSESLPGTDSYGTATDADLVFDWALTKRGEPYQGNLYFHLESRWNWGTTGPQSLGGGSLGMLQNTGNTYEKYVPVSIMRNFYYQIGSTKSKGALRFGKVTIDSILGTNRHLTPNTTCLSYTCTGAFAIGLPDSALGVVGAWHFNDSVKLLGAVIDSNGDRKNLGHVREGDFFYALDFGVKIAPKSEQAGYSHLIVWHNDGTRDGKPKNGSNGPKGWGFFALYEQELSNDGNNVAIFKYGKSYNDSAFYETQITGALVFHDPHFFGTIRNDAVGVSYNWIDAVTEGARREQNVEVFYRFPLFPGLDTTLSYIAVINPALDHTNDFASVFSLRFVTVF
jgi:porin